METKEHFLFEKGKPDLEREEGWQRKRDITYQGEVAVIPLTCLTVCPRRNVLGDTL